MTQEANINMKQAMDSFFQGFMKEQKINRLKNYKTLNKYAKKGQILFVGSSLMEYFPINELLQSLELDYTIYNRGIGGYVTTELLTSMEECIFELEPSKIFINIGTNDIGLPEYSQEKLIASYDTILTQISERLPQCKVYVMSYYPVNAKADFPGIDQGRKEFMFKTRTNQAIIEANTAVEKLSENHGYEFIDVNEGLADEEGNLKVEYAIEGLHMWPNAYAVILNNLKKYL